MITTYFLISAFLLGWMLCATHHGHIKSSFWDLVGTIALCVAWPYFAFLLIKHRKELWP